MDSKREELWRDTSAAHRDIQGSTFRLNDIARAISYLHPNLADDLIEIARDIESARKRIQGNDGELVNMELQDSQRFMGETLMALIGKCSSQKE